ncbi:MAG TPA: alpha-L-fucosidase [Puia sp.]|nr:alpha-L-fucosidase [Puia sp.]
MIKNFKYTFIAFLLQMVIAHAQNDPGKYTAPKDTMVIKKLSEWQDQKFGLFMHWGTYSQWGADASWTICPDDWVKRTGPYSNNYFEYKQAYENLQASFNPVAFNPAKWAKAAKETGMRYVVFTTKHHDGFCMFDTKQTDYKITSPKTAFSANPKSNITKEIFDAFRKEGFMTGAYFSKPDWHSENYWWPYFPPKDHNVNYSPSTYPERWRQFQDYTYNQVEELMTGYGKVDILWLDGGWVRPPAQDLNMPRMATMARTHQPGLIIVDRTVSGEFENYTTPEQEVPEKPLPYPWETCMTMGTTWSYSPHDTYKPVWQLVELLVKIVSRGGNFLLNVGPDGHGDWDPIVYDRLKEIGEWMKINGEGIYASQPVVPYSVDNIYFTQSKKERKIYAFWLAGKETVLLSENIQLPATLAPAIKQISLLGARQKLKWTVTGDHIIIHIPAALRQNALKQSAVFRIEY